MSWFGLNLFRQIHSKGYLLVGVKACQAFVLSYQAFVSGQEGREDARHLRSSPSLLSTDGWSLFSSLFLSSNLSNF